MATSCSLCRGNGFTFSFDIHRGSLGAAPCCVPPEIRKRFENNFDERAYIIHRYAVTEDAITLAEKAIAQYEIHKAQARQAYIDAEPDMPAVWSDTIKSDVAAPTKWNK